MIEEILEKTGYRKEIEEEGEVESETRLQNIEELINKAAAYWEGAEEPTLGGFLEEVALVAEVDNMNESENRVVLMTLHSAKGLEFPYVYLSGMEDGLFPSSMSILSDDADAVEEERRLCYVGITRAKSRLFIHTNTAVFQHLSAAAYSADRQVYEMPDEILLQLSHKDVHLGFFKDRKKDVLALRGGDALVYGETLLYSRSTGKPVAKLSSKMQNTLSEWEERGYGVKSASVRFVVAWKPKDAPKSERETAVLLADLLLAGHRREKNMGQGSGTAQ